MFVLPKPRATSKWIDNELGVTYIVQDMILDGPSKGDMAVVCRHENDTEGERQWDDAMPLECFATELKEIK